MTLVSDLDEAEFEAAHFCAETDPIIRTYGDEEVAWSPRGHRPVHLTPVSSLIFQMLDGTATTREIIDDVHEVIGIPRTIAGQQIKNVIAMLDNACLLTSSLHEQTDLGLPDPFPAGRNH